MLTLPLFLFFQSIYHSQATKRFHFWQFFFSSIPLYDLLNPVVQSHAASLHKGHFLLRNTGIPSTVSQIDAKMLKFTKHLVSDMKNTRIWSSCFHLQKQSWRKTGGLSFNCYCWLAKWRGESKRQLTATLTARMKSHPLLLNPAVSTFFQGFFFLFLSFFIFYW